MNQRIKFPLHLVFVFCVTVFIAITSSMILIGAIFTILFRNGIITRPQPVFFIITIALLSILLSTLIAGIIGVKIFLPIQRLSYATKEVAKGNYQVTLNENTKIEEIQNMVHDFNIMTRELENTEIIHNDFTQNVSHEFKTPLSAIEGYATLLQNKNLNEEKRLFYASKIVDSTRRLTTLVNNILELTRLENQQMELKREKFSMDEQIREVILLYEEIWMQKEIELNLELPNVLYYGNERLLFQVWQNIFSNAINYSKDKGIILITLNSTSSNIVVSISDFGIGMSEDIKKRIFEKFYQGDTSHSNSGNGLGLALVKRIVELHKGTIEVTSEKGKGSTFTVTIPNNM